MELHKNLVKEGRIIKVSVQNFSKAVPKDWMGQTAISGSAERGSTMDRSENKWCEGSSNHNGGCSVYFLLDKRPSSERINDSQKTNKIPIQTSKSTVNLDNSLREEICVSPHGVNNVFKINTSEPPSESEKNFVWSINDRFQYNQTKDSGNPREVRLKELAHASTGSEWESVDESRTLGLRQLCRNQRVDSVIPVETRPSNKNVYNFHKNTTNKVAMQELSADDELQHEEDLSILLNFNKNTTNKVSMQELSADDGTRREEDLQSLLSLLKIKYPFREETNKNILYDDETHRFTEFYNITDFSLVLSCYDLIFWLKDLNGDIYMWSRTDESMIFGGHNMKEALTNFLFCQEKLCYVEEYTRELISVKKVKDEVDKCYEEGKKAVFVVTDELLKPLKDEKKGSKEGGKQKKRQKKKNK